MSDTRGWFWRRCLGVCIAVFSTVGCVAAVPSGEKADVPAGGKSDAWAWDGAPQRFELALETRLDALPSEGRATVVPWSETYWPSMEDSYNVRWNGPRELSPLEKYDLAYNGWEPPPGFFDLRPLTRESCETGEWDPEYYRALGPAARFWSDFRGVGRARNGIDDDGDGQTDECDDLDGMAFWWGSCHAWTPASMLEPEPLDAVEVNGVTFYPSDIKALIILMYEESRQIAIGDRCQLDTPPRDASGRIEDPYCRNTNPGAFHLLLTNLLGLQGRSFGEDRVAGSQVWNQPLVGYRVLQQREVDEAEALRLLSRTEAFYPFNDDAERFVEVEVDVDYVIEAHASVEPSTPRIDEYIRTDRYHYVLEMDADGEVLGGEWIGSDNHWNWAEEADRPDFVWLPIGPGRMLNPHVRVSAIRELSRRAHPDTRGLEVRVYDDLAATAIPDFPYGPLERTIRVPDPLVPREVAVYVSISHGWIFDLVVTLVRGDERVVLLDRNARGSSTDFSATVPIPALAGQDASGDWRLEVTDRNARSAGQLLEWSLILTSGGESPPPPPEPSTPEPESPASRPSTFTPSGSSIEIPDGDAVGVESVLDVPAYVEAVSAIVRVDIEHSYRGDLEVALERGAVRRMLHQRGGGAQDDLQLEMDVSDMLRGSAAGEWRLVVRDLASVDRGVLHDWSLSFEPLPEPPPRP